MKILFVCRAFDNMAGGVERSSIRLMNNIVDKGMEVDLLTWDLDNATSFYAMKSEIIWHRLNLGHSGKKASYILKLQRARFVRNLVRKRNIDIIVCFQSGTFLAMKIYLFNMGVPIIAAERESPFRYNNIKARCYKYIYFQSYRFASRLVLQCKSYASSYPSYLQKHITTISNPVYPADIYAKPHIPDNGRFRMLSVGRLSYPKNHTVLIQAFVKIAGEFPKWDLIIIGEGEERQYLQALVEEFGLSERVFLLGTNDNLTEWYVKSHAFCLPSIHEGFPNALAEALSHGLPAVGFSECTGTNELIQTNKNGLLAKGNSNPSSLAEEFKKIMKDDESRKTMGCEAMKSMGKYNPKNIYGLWKKMLIEIARD